jgi:hypothetical protein
MRTVVLASRALALALTFAAIAVGAVAQEPTPPAPYKPVAVKVPQVVNDPSLDAFRKEIAAAAQRRDRAALARMIVAKGFFWERDDGTEADKSKSGADNLAAAFDLEGGGSAGWEALGKAVSEPHAGADPQRKGVVCAPPAPDLNGKDFETLVQATKTDPNEWGFVYTAGTEVRADPKADAPVIEQLAPSLVRVTIDESPLHAVQGVNTDWLRIVTPNGKIGYVAASAVGALIADQICYAKEASGWKIAGIVGGSGGGDQQ